MIPNGRVDAVNPRIQVSGNVVDAWTLAAGTTTAPFEKLTPLNPRAL
jgi:hypothetical protein